MTKTFIGHILPLNELNTENFEFMLKQTINKYFNGNDIKSADCFFK